MNYPKTNRFHYGIAGASDGPEILEILEENDFKGQIGLIYTRRPDPYVSFQLEGKDTIILLCRDTMKNKIVGFGVFAIRKLYVDGEASEVGYLFGLRMRKEYRGVFPLIPKAYQFMNELIKEKSITYHITTILEENTYAQKLLEKKRKIMPGYIPLTRYGTFVFKTGGRFKARPGYRLKRAGDDDRDEMLDFMNSQGRRSQFYPVLDAGCFSGKVFPGLGSDDFLILYNNENEIVACGAAWDQRGYKQYILKEYGGFMKGAYYLSFVFRPFGFPTLPKPGSMLNFFTLSFLVVKDNDPEILKTYINFIAKEMNNYPYFLIGVSADNPLSDILMRLSFISYWSKAYLVDWNKNVTLTDLDHNRPIHLECGLL